MEMFYFNGIVFLILLTFIADGRCNEEASGPLLQNTSQETPESTNLPSVALNQSPGWWIGPVQLDSTPNNVTESENETPSTENRTLNEELTNVPVIVVKNPLEDHPEVIVGTVRAENTTSDLQIQNKSQTSKESEFDMTEFLIPDGGLIEEDIVIIMPNGTLSWFDDFFIFRDNVTNGTENSNLGLETTVLPPETSTGSTVPSSTGVQETLTPPATGPSTMNMSSTEL